MNLFTSKHFKIDVLSEHYSSCHKCKLSAKCNTPQFPVTGKNKKGLMIIAECPSAEADKRGVFLYGESGNYLFRNLHELGLEKDDCTCAYAIQCHTTKPDNKHISFCRPNLWSVLTELKPKVILVLGMKSLHALIGHRWHKKGSTTESNLGTMDRWFDAAIPDRQIKSWIVPCYSMAELLYLREKMPVVDVWVQKCLKNAIRHLDVPFPVYKDEAQCVHVLTKEEEIAAALHAVIQNKNTIAFDYETTGLKPYREGHKIWYIGIATSPDFAFVFPCQKNRNALKLFRQILQDETIPKIAHNMPYEDTWSIVRLGVQVKGWCLDTELTSHILNQNNGRTGLKFQTYLTTGLIDYSSHISSYLSETTEDSDVYGDNTINQIHKCPPQEVMLYCGIDCLSTYRIATMHAKELGLSIGEKLCAH